jgi:ArsR family transcriptional regulator
MFANQQSPGMPVDAPEPPCLEQLAALCKASGDQLRLQVLRVLRHDSLGVQELCSIFDIRQPAMSHHLKVLARAGAVTSRREGNTIFYRRATLGQHPALTELQSSLFLAVDQLTLPPAMENRLSELQEQRQQSSREFFQQNADKFRAQQDLIASYEQYAETVAQLQRNAPLSRRRLALEVGPGDGAFLQELAPAFEQVVALDNSAEMLEKARALAAKQSLSNVKFIHGDTRHPDLQGLEADCIVVNMVLHHTPSPADIFADLAGILAPAGVLLVTDLCNHDQAWARENCGDLWLGFEPGDLQLWAHSAGLSEIASEYLAQRNGFQIQVRLFGRRHNHSRNDH